MRAAPLEAAAAASLTLTALALVYCAWLLHRRRPAPAAAPALLLLAAAGLAAAALASGALRWTFASLGVVGVGLTWPAAPRRAALVAGRRMRARRREQADGQS